jgi:hypothetical protein
MHALRPGKLSAPVELARPTRHGFATAFSPVSIPRRFSASVRDRSSPIPNPVGQIAERSVAFGSGSTLSLRGSHKYAPDSASQTPSRLHARSWVIGRSVAEYYSQSLIRELWALCGR